MEKTDRYGFDTLKKVATSGFLLRLSLIGITVQFVAFATYFAFVPVYADSIGASLSTIGYITSFTLAAAMTGTLIAPFVIARIGYRATIPATLIVVGAATAAVTLTNSTLSLLIIQGIAGLGHGLLSAALMALAALSAVPRLRATAMGLYQSSYGVGVLDGP